MGNKPHDPEVSHPLFVKEVVVFPSIHFRIAEKKQGLALVTEDETQILRPQIASLLNASHGKWFHHPRREEPSN